MVVVLQHLQFCQLVLFWKDTEIIKRNISGFGSPLKENIPFIITSLTSKEFGDNEEWIIEQMEFRINEYEVKCDLKIVGSKIIMILFNPEVQRCQA